MAWGLTYWLPPDHALEQRGFLLVCPCVQDKFLLPGINIYWSWGLVNGMLGSVS